MNLNWLKAQVDQLRASASRGPVSGAEIFTFTDPIMDRIAKTAGALAFKREKYGADVATIHEDGDQIVEVVRRGDGRFDLTIHCRRAHGDLWDDMTVTLSADRFTALGQVPSAT